MAEKSILELHDARYKAIFSHPRAVEDLLRLLVPLFRISPEWMARLMFETLERVPSEWIDKRLRRKYGDLVWRLKLRDGDRETWVHVFVMVEFQSTVERYMALRVRTYADLLYGALPEGTEQRGLPPILPIVLYNGLSRWTAPLSVAALVHPSVAPFEPPAQPWFTGESYILMCARR